MSFELDDIAQLADTLLKYKSGQDKLNLTNDIAKMQNETTLLLHEQQGDLERGIETDKLNLGANQRLLETQRQEINSLNKKLAGWDLSWEDHLQLPSDFKSSDGKSVIDEHTNKFKGKLYESFESGNDTLDIIQNTNNSIEYNSKVLEALNKVEQKYVRGQGFTDNVKTDLFLQNIKDGVDLSSTILEYQNDYMADTDMISLSEEDWGLKYPNLIKAGVQYDSEMTIDKLNSTWSDWEFITDQTVKMDANGMPFVVTRGPEASPFLQSPEWKGLMDQLGVETQTVTGTGEDWDTNIGLHVQDRIAKNILNRSRLSAGSKAINQFQKAIGSRDEYIIDGTTDYLKSMLKSIHNDIGSPTKPTVGDTLYDNIVGVVKDWNTIGDNWFSVNNVSGLREDLEQSIIAIARESSNWDLTPDLIQKMVEDGDTPNLMAILLHGTTLDEIDNNFAGKGAPFNYYRTHLSSKSNSKQYLNDKGGLFKKVDVGTISNAQNNSGVKINPGDWFGGKDKITYKDIDYSQGKASGEAFDFYSGWGNSQIDQQTFKSILELYEVVYDLEMSRGYSESGLQYGAGGYWNEFQPDTQMTNLTGNEIRSIVQEDPPPECLSITILDI